MHETYISCYVKVGTDLLNIECVQQLLNESMVH